MTEWPKNITQWHDGRKGFMSIPFTWLLPTAQRIIAQRQLWVDDWTVGGPAVELMPTFLRGATVGHEMLGVLQRVNQYATRTTVGCPKRCGFCAIGRGLIEPEFRELDDWPDRPVICDNNLLAAGRRHFDRVITDLKEHCWCDIQGVDASLVTPWHARHFVKLRRPILRLAVDTDADRDVWARAIDRLLTAGVAKSHIRTYVLCGWKGSPEDDWHRCEFVESFGIKALPMWFHPLNALAYNQITDGQRQRGWDRAGQRQLMQWYYQHRGKKLIA